MPPDEPTAEEKQEELPGDEGATPFQPATPPASDGKLDDTHPATDTNIQPEELYDEGVTGAAEASEPNSGSDVNGYTPPPSDDDPVEDK